LQHPRLSGLCGLLFELGLEVAFGELGDDLLGLERDRALDVDEGQGLGAFALTGLALPDEGFLVDGVAGVEPALGAFEDQGGVGLGFVADAHFEGGLGGGDAGALQQGVAAALGGELARALQLGDLGFLPGAAVAGFGLGAAEGNMNPGAKRLAPRELRVTFLRSMTLCTSCTA
jgi:hypothetical protein